MAVEYKKKGTLVPLNEKRELPSMSAFTDTRFDESLPKIPGMPPWRVSACSVDVISAYTGAAKRYRWVQGEQRT